MSIKFYPERDLMIDIMKRDIPLRINFNDCDNEIKKCWDAFQSLRKTIPEDELRNSGLIGHIKTKGLSQFLIFNPKKSSKKKSIIPWGHGEWR